VHFVIQYNLLLKINVKLVISQYCTCTRYMY